MKMELAILCLAATLATGNASGAQDRTDTVRTVPDLPADADRKIDQTSHVREGFYVTRGGVRVPIPRRPEDENARREPVDGVPAMQVLGR